MPLSNSQNQCPKAEVSHVTNQNIDHTENTFDSISFDQAVCDVWNKIHVKENFESKRTE